VFSELPINNSLKKYEIEVIKGNRGMSETIHVYLDMKTVFLKHGIMEHILDRDYIYIDSTQSLCHICLKKVDAKLLIKDKKIFMKKSCGEHGESTSLIEDDAGYYMSRMYYRKPGTISKTQTKNDKGCPFDCGLCPVHEQHSCINLINITDNCPLGCNTCYLSSGKSDRFLSLKKIDEMLDFIVDSEYGKAEIVQISGGEPTTHPDILKILELVKSKNIKFMMLNTNGIRIGEDEKFAEQLAAFKGRFEIYLQFDGLKSETYARLRGRDLLPIKMKAIKNLHKYGIPVTLVSVIEKGTNDDEIGDLIEFGINTNFIRGINFQPISYFGRIGKVSPEDRSTVTSVINDIERQTRGKIKKSDIIPLPCDPDKISLTFLVRNKNKFMPITRKINVKEHLSIINNSLSFVPGDFFQNALKNLWSLPGFFSSFDSMKEISCCIPYKPGLLMKKERLNFVDNDTFRISIVSFQDAYNFDVKSVKSECIHFITPDLHKIPFSTFNIFNRGQNDIILL
jgi:7,8-dihydro-6-hydroxymethylpterin dimethyltransferase